jgi:Ca-activated chloride channel family protein
MKTLQNSLKKVSVIFLFMAIVINAYTQNNVGEIRGKVTDKKVRSAIEYATLVLKKDGNIIQTTSSNEDGSYFFRSLAAGEYSIYLTYVGYKKYIAAGIVVAIGNINFWNIELESLGEDGVDLGSVSISCSKRNLFSSDNNKKILGNKQTGTLNTKSIELNEQKVIRSDRSGESYSKINENGFRNPYSNPLSTFSIDVDKASYSIIRSYLKGDQTPPQDAVRIEEMINYFDYNYPDPQQGELLAMHTEMGKCPWNEKHLLLKIGVNAKKMDRKSLQGSNLVFLIDVSGSMDSHDKLPLVKKSLLLLLNQLDDKDNIALVVYAGNSGLVLPSTPCSQKNIIKKAIEDLSAGGSTAGGEGIVLAYKVAQNSFIKGGVNRVILATDGDFNVGLTSEKELEDLIVQKRKSNIYLTVLGFGQGNYMDSKMETLADKGNGNYAYIDNIREAKKILVREMMETTITVANDVKIQIEFNPLLVESYRLIGYENRALENEDFKNDEKDAGEMGSGSSVTAFYEIIPRTDNAENTKEIDSFRYRNITSSNQLYNQEIGFLKLRYKTELNSKSILQNAIISNTVSNSLSDDFYFAASVVQMGLLLRNSENKGFSNYYSALNMAQNHRGNDPDGDKDEFISMISKAKALSNR